jgi:hypothetical protein
MIMSVERMAKMIVREEDLPIVICSIRTHVKCFTGCHHREPHQIQDECHLSCPRTKGNGKTPCIKVNDKDYIVVCSRADTSSECLYGCEHREPHTYNDGCHTTSFCDGLDVCCREVQSDNNVAL